MPHRLPCFLPGRPNRSCPYFYLGMPRACSQLLPVVVRSPAEAAVVWRVDPVVVSGPAGAATIEQVYYPPGPDGIPIMRALINKAPGTGG